MMIFFSVIITFFVTIFCVVLLCPLALRLNLIDTPDIRKQHQGNIPLIGGLAMLMGFLVGLLTLPISLQNYRSFIAGSALLVFVGMLDDFRELSAKSRFLAQIIAVLLMIFWGNVYITYLGNLFFLKAIYLGHYTSLIVTLIAGLGIINTINMIDGVDGLAGTLVLVELILLIYCAMTTQHFPVATLLLLLAASVLGFLCFNFPFPGRAYAQLFMGDAGSMLLGFSLVWFLIELSQSNFRPITPVTMLWIMSVPLFDATAVMLYRLIKGQSVIFSDRQHGHHLLLALNFSPLQINILFGSANFVLGLVGLCAFYYRFNESVMFMSFLLFFIFYFFVVNYCRNLLVKNSK
ncbi:undecaprenyl-phosphate alpha-N-acetylglucosaminyl 1-phosphate transferase [Candidatus Rickettsiella isopodorum]|jgi:UDP-GlcNAc:undecaprenyl-phosphate GlcNAc-1-phosphate transferase|uniref:Undecaprenyl-phosphate alpha-N-acetylglucosaminyl 1-phosphate transferase n=1 Tax=Candidatus Rickettsiella isopodorum TaxID=1225476 RepID=A0A1J8P5V8_9COXI|nr:MraY family glycosyltransferase [Candidatus Rickettsiella isopodorum]OIZ95180.1 undecaprenyl-phosphate alpha-N-acetylglucosaminyl 1-phosphate transferase [Candidatus Rickettsiella isopodorum]